MNCKYFNLTAEKAKSVSKTRAANLSFGICNKSINNVQIFSRIKFTFVRALSFLNSTDNMPSKWHRIFKKGNVIGPGSQWHRAN